MDLFITKQNECEKDKPESDTYHFCSRLTEETIFNLNVHIQQGSLGNGVSLGSHVPNYTSNALEVWKNGIGG